MRPLKITLIIGLCGLLSAASCRKDVAGGTVVSATGYVYDAVLQKPVHGATVYMIGVKKGAWLGPSLLQDTGFVASTQADARGNFSISYHARGNYEGYVLALTYRPSLTSLPVYNRNYVPDGVYTFDPSYRGQGVELKARFLQPAFLTLTDSRPDTVQFSVSNNDLAVETIKIAPMPSDTTLLIYVLPYGPNVITYFKNYSSTLAGQDSLSPAPGDTLRVTRHF